MRLILIIGYKEDEQNRVRGVFRLAPLTPQLQACLEVLQRSSHQLLRTLCSDGLVSMRHLGWFDSGRLLMLAKRPL